MVVVNATEWPAVSKGMQPLLMEEIRLVQRENAERVLRLEVRAAIGVVNAHGSVRILVVGIRALIHTLGPCVVCLCLEAVREVVLDRCNQSVVVRVRSVRVVAEGAEVRVQRSTVSDSVGIQVHLVKQMT